MALCVRSNAWVLLIFLVLQLSVVQLLHQTLVANYVIDDDDNDTSDIRPQESSAVADDWFDEDLWLMKSSQSQPPGGEKRPICPYVENLCHASQHFFYDNHGQNGNTAESPRHPRHQPYPLSLQLTEYRYGPATLVPHPKIVTIHPSIPGNLGCLYSNIPNHMILHGSYSEMLGEWYMRVFLGFISIFQHLTMDQPGKDLEPLFMAGTQLYLSTVNYRKSFQLNILDSQQLLAGLFTSNLVLPLNALLKNTKCQCMRRVFFCGFHETLTPQNTSMLAFSPELKYRDIVHSSKSNADEHQTQEETQWQLTRQIILDRAIHDNPFIQEEIRRIQTAHLMQAQVLPDNATTIEANNALLEWRFVGLSQRTKRRKWRNLDECITACNEHFLQHKVLCVEISLEDESTLPPLKQLATHASLHAFMGIHGAQLLQALFLPEGALFVEFLPWIRKDTWGAWTRFAHKPTPVGKVFNGTKLDHIGYPLPIESASHVNCHGIIDKRNGSLVMCLKHSRHRWDNREFSVPVGDVLSILSKFALPSGPQTCQHLNQEAGDEFVLYNVNCVRNASINNASTVNHFYRHPNWIHEVTGSDKEE